MQHNGFKDIGIRKSEFVAKTQFLCYLYIVIVRYIVHINTRGGRVLCRLHRGEEKRYGSHKQLHLYVPQYTKHVLKISSGIDYLLWFKNLFWVWDMKTRITTGSETVHFLFNNLKGTVSVIASEPPWKGDKEGCPRNLYLHAD